MIIRIEGAQTSLSRCPRQSDILRGVRLIGAVEDECARPTASARWREADRHLLTETGTNHEGPPSTDETEERRGAWIVDGHHQRCGRATIGNIQTLVR